MKSYSLFIPGVLILLAACNQIPSTILSEDEKAIRLRRDFSNNAIARHDTASIATVWTEDYNLVTSRNITAAGRKANLDGIASTFALRPDINFIRSPESIKIYSPWGMAAETGTWIGYWSENGSKVNVSGSYYAKWHKLNNQWYIRAEIFTMLKCDGGESCEKGPI